MKNLSPKTWLIFTVMGCIVINLLMFQQIKYISLSNFGMTLGIKHLLNEDKNLSRKADLEDAIATLSREKSLAAANRFQTRKVIIGNLYWEIDQKQLAKKYWDEIGLEPEFFIRQVSQVHSQNELDYIDRAIFLSPRRSELLYEKGLYFEKNADIHSARMWYDLAAKYDHWVNPILSFDILFEHGNFLFKKRQLAEAAEVLYKALEFSDEAKIDDSPKFAIIHRWLGLISHQNGELSKARFHFLQAIKLNPADFWNYINLGLIAEAEKQAPETIFKYFDSARRVAPHDIYAYTYPAQHFFNTNQLDNWRYFCEQTPAYLRRNQQWIEACQVMH